MNFNKITITTFAFLVANVSVNSMQSINTNTHDTMNEIIVPSQVLSNTSIMNLSHENNNINISESNMYPSSNITSESGTYQSTNITSESSMYLSTNRPLRYIPMFNIGLASRLNKWLEIPNAQSNNSSLRNPSSMSYPIQQEAFQNNPWMCLSSNINQQCAGLHTILLIHGCNISQLDDKIEKLNIKIDNMQNDMNYIKKAVQQINKQQTSNNSKESQTTSNILQTIEQPVSNNSNNIQINSDILQHDIHTLQETIKITQYVLQHDINTLLEKTQEIQIGMHALNLKVNNLQTKTQEVQIGMHALNSKLNTLQTGINVVSGQVKTMFEKVINRNKKMNYTNKQFNLFSYKPNVSTGRNKAKFKQFKNGNNNKFSNNNNINKHNQKGKTQEYKYNKVNK